MPSDTAHDRRLFGTDVDTEHLGERLCEIGERLQDEDDDLILLGVKKTEDVTPEEFVQTDLTLEFPHTDLLEDVIRYEDRADD